MHRIFFLAFCLVSCQENAQSPALLTRINASRTYTSIAEIPLPEGYTRIRDSVTDFSHWLRERPLKKDNTVYLYDGRPKGNQQAQFAVLDIPVGKKTCSNVRMPLCGCGPSICMIRKDGMRSAFSRPVDRPYLFHAGSKGTGIGSKDNGWKNTGPVRHRATPATNLNNTCNWYSPIAARAHCTGNCVRQMRLNR